VATLSELQTNLSYLLGDTSAPTTSSEDWAIRMNFINRQIERLYNMREWEHLVTSATISLTNKSYTFGSTVVNPRIPGGLKDVREVVDNGDDRIYTEVDYDQFYSDETVEYVYYMTGKKLTSNQTTDLSLRYLPAAPSLATSADAVDFPINVITRGAMIDLKESEDPEQDLSQDRSRYDQELSAYLSLHNRSHAKKQFSWGSANIGE
jgi:hypothetical protein